MCCWSKNCRRLPMRMRTDAAAGPIAPITPTAPASLRKDPRNPIPIAIALAAGALNVFAFAPFGLWPLQIGCAALLFALVMQAPSVRRAAVLGWLYSFAWTCGGVWWLYISLHDMGGLPAVITILAIALLALGLGLIVGAATGGARWLQRRHATAAPVTLLMTLPALWMLAEWTRSWIFTGFPWLSTGLAHTGSPLAGFAPVIGVYGISLVAAVIAWFADPRQPVPASLDPDPAAAGRWSGPARHRLDPSTRQADHGAPAAGEHPPGDEVRRRDPRPDARPLRRADHAGAGRPDRHA
jgi:hypothetical protein